MCIAIHKPKGVIIPQAHLEESFVSNPDGAGFTVCLSSGKLVSRKGFFTIEAFNAAFRSYTSFPALIHFRIATSGGINPEMCHPFELCGGKYSMIHNGVLDLKPHKGKSDTATFADSVLTPLLARGIHPSDPAFKFLVEGTIGKWNKILIMDNSGKVTYFNEKEGHRFNKIWYSNNSYLSPILPKPTYSGKWNEADWKKWAGNGAVATRKGTRKGTLLTEMITCEICSEFFESDGVEECCPACIRDWQEEMVLS